MCGFSSAARAQQVEHLAGAALEQPDVDEVDAERGDGFGMFGRCLVRERFERERFGVVEVGRR